MNLMANIVAMIRRRKLPQEPNPAPNPLPSGLTPRFTRLAVLGRLSDGLAIEIIDGEPVMCVEALPMPINVFMVALAEAMNGADISVDDRRAMEKKLVAFWLRSGVPPSMHELATRDAWWAAVSLIEKRVREWRNSPDPIGSFTEALIHLDDLYAMAKARADDEGAMAEATLSGG